MMDALTARRNHRGAARWIMYTMRLTGLISTPKLTASAQVEPVTEYR